MIELISASEGADLTSMSDAAHRNAKTLRTLADQFGTWSASGHMRRVIIGRLTGSGVSEGNAEAAVKHLMTSLREASSAIRDAGYEIDAICDAAANVLETHNEVATRKAKTLPTGLAS